MGKYMLLYFSFFLIFLKGLHWLGTRIFIKIVYLWKDNIQVLLKPKAIQHLKQFNPGNLPGRQSSTTQIETQNHININYTNLDYEKILLLLYPNRNIKNMALGVQRMARNGCTY